MMATIEIVTPATDVPGSYEDEWGSDPLVLRMDPALKLTEEQFFNWACQNDQVHIEVNAEGEVLIMPPTGMESGESNLNLSKQFAIWVERDETGHGFDSSSMFTMPNSAKRSPDATWISNARWNQVSPQERKIFSKVVPEFVAELRSRRDRVKTLQAKMEEYIDNGVQLGWLIDPLQKRVHIYRAGQPVQVLDNPATISGDPALPGFVLKLGEIWG
jgi:Uma2 family endonuclease